MHEQTDSVATEQPSLPESGRNPVTILTEEGQVTLGKNKEDVYTTIDANNYRTN